jgi:hypothetical protein
MSRCTVCGEQAREGCELRHLSIYANGSEGVEACIGCTLAITEFVRAMQGVAARAAIRSHKDRKEAKP